MGLFSRILNNLKVSVLDRGRKFGDTVGHIKRNTESLGEEINQFVDNVDLSDALTNTWNKFTGNAHLTPEYQHAEEREDSVNQRTALDMMAAGLSKYGLNGSPAGTSSAANGLTLLDAVSKMQSIKANNIALKQARHDFDLTEKLGIRSGDKNVLGSITSVLNALFGLNMDDVPEEGIIPYFINLFKNAGDGSTAGAMADTAGAAMSTGAKASPEADPVSKVEQSIGLRPVPGTFKKVYGVDLSPFINNPDVPKTSAEAKAQVEKVAKSDTYGNVKGMLDLSLYGKSFKDAASKFIAQMDADKMLTMNNLNSLADRMSKIYNMELDSVKKYFAYLFLQLHPMQIPTH